MSRIHRSTPHHASKSRAVGEAPKATHHAGTKHAKAVGHSPHDTFESAHKVVGHKHKHHHKHHPVLAHAAGAGGNIGSNLPHVTSVASGVNISATSEPTASNTLDVATPK